MGTRIFTKAIAYLSSVGCLVGCAQTTVTPRGGAPANIIYVNQEMRYADPTSIDPVFNECTFPQHGMNLLETAVQAAGFVVVRDDQAVKEGRGRTFQVEIVSVVLNRLLLNRGSTVTVKGRLLEDGKEIGIFQGARSSRGGAFGDFKGTCSIAGRNLRALANDISVWLKDPKAGRSRE